MQKKDFKPEGAMKTDVAAFNKLVIDNERLKQRVDALEKSLKEAQKEILTLQQCMSSLISTELRMVGSESKEHCPTETVAASEYLASCNRSNNEISQSNEHPKGRENLTKNRGKNHREAGDYNRERLTIPNRYRSSKARCSNSRGTVDNERTNRENAEHSYRDYKHSIHNRIDKMTDKGSEYSSRQSDHTNKCRADENRRSSVGERSQQPDSKYLKKRYFPDISTFDNHDKYDRDERNGNAVRNRDRVDNFSHERRASQNRHNLRNNEPPSSYCQSDSERTKHQHYIKRSEKSPDHSSRQRHERSSQENRIVDSNRRKCVVEKGQQQNFKYSEERSLTIKRPTSDERDRKDDDFKRGCRLDQNGNDTSRKLCDRSKHSTGLSNMLNGEERTESLLPRREDMVMTKSVPSQKIVEKPRSLNEVPTTNKRQKIIQDSEAKEKSQYFVNDRISPPVSKETVSKTVEKVVPEQKLEQSADERRSEGAIVELDVPPSSNKITFWSDTGKVESTVESEYLRKIYRTPMRLINEFTNYKMLSPLPDTPKQSRNELNETKSVEINRIPSSSNLSTPNKGNESSSDTKVESAPACEEIAKTFSEDEDRIRNSMIDDVKIQTTSGTDEAEHGVFKRRRRKLF